MSTPIINGESIVLNDIKQDEENPFPDGFICYAESYNAINKKIGRKIEAVRSADQTFSIDFLPSDTIDWKGNVTVIITVESVDGQLSGKSAYAFSVSNYSE